MLRGLYSPHGTHVLPGMSEEQARKARRWEKPSLLVAVLIVPALVAHIEGWLAFVPQAVLIGITLFLLAEAFSMIRLSSIKEWASSNVLDIVVLLAAISSLPFGTDHIWSWISVLMMLRLLDLLPVANRYFFHVTPLGFAMTVLLLVILMGAMAFTDVEMAESGKDISFIKSLYWASATVIAVGYGDITPTGDMSMVVSILFQISGLVAAALLVAAAVEMFSRQFTLAFVSRHAPQHSEEPLKTPGRWPQEDRDGD